MVLLLGPTDASWQELARFRARTKWPQEASRILPPDALGAPADLPVEDVAGVVLDGTRQDLAEFYAQQGVPVEVVEAVVAPEAPAGKPEPPKRRVIRLGCLDIAPGAVTTVEVSMEEAAAYEGAKTRSLTMAGGHGPLNPGGFEVSLEGDQIKIKAPASSKKGLEGSDPENDANLILEWH